MAREHDRGMRGALERLATDAYAIGLRFELVVDERPIEHGARPVRNTATDIDHDEMAWLGEELQQAGELRRRQGRECLIQVGLAKEQLQIVAIVGQAARQLVNIECSGR